MTAKQMENSYVVVADRVYQPEVVPVDYVGLMVYSVGITLQDRTYLQKSSLEFDDRQNFTQELCERVLTLLTAACQEHYEKTGVLPCESYNRPQITERYLGLKYSQ
ncbi:hypothetical protein [Hydrogenoanaerobacterium sp.]|uniref:hypothetical protein n=1 Tax=Hydrogenoanaerobacterium sp. TaxID=2953763 RepID=UPI00289E42B4|nr:hypothetical protein [Hydrogenoanaerobacterium sp.]